MNSLTFGLFIHVTISLLPPISPVHSPCNKWILSSVYEYSLSLYYNCATIGSGMSSTLRAIKNAHSYNYALTHTHTHTHTYTHTHTHTHTLSHRTTVYFQSLLLLHRHLPHHYLAPLSANPIILPLTCVRLPIQSSGKLTAMKREVNWSYQSSNLLIQWIGRKGTEVTCCSIRWRDTKYHTSIHILVHVFVCTHTYIRKHKKNRS